MNSHSRVCAEAAFVLKAQIINPAERTPSLHSFSPPISPITPPSHSLLQLKCILYWYGLLLFCSIKLKLVRRWHDKMFNNKVKNIIVISRVFNSEILGRLKISRFSPFLWPFVKNRSLFPFSEWVFLYIYIFVFSIF